VVVMDGDGDGGCKREGTEGHIGRRLPSSGVVKSQKC
jgi:hypothetical protein